MKTIKLLEGRECLRIKAIAGDFPYSLTSKLTGERYRRFASNGLAFVADVRDKFCNDFDLGNVYSIELGVSEGTGTNADGEAVDQLSLNGHTTILQELNMAKTEVLLKSFTLENIIASKITDPDEIIALHTK